MKYDTFKDYLASLRGQEVPLSFAEIERIIGRKLPASARKYPAWWSNNPSNNVMTTAWLEAGYKSERVDVGSERLVFKRAAQTKGSTPPSEIGSNPLANLYGALRATLRLRSDVDLTRPTGEVWDAETR